MKNCWNFVPEQRPCFAELVKDITQKFQLTKDKKPPPLQSTRSAAYLKLY